MQRTVSLAALVESDFRLTSQRALRLESSANTPLGVKCCLPSFLAFVTCLRLSNWCFQPESHMTVKIANLSAGLRGNVITPASSEYDVRSQSVQWND